MNIFDYFKNNEIKLIEKRKESLDRYFFLFESEYPIYWKAGQNGMFKFSDENLEGGNSRMFSLASSPHEKNILIGTKIGEKPSEFKDKLKSMEIGESIYLRGPLGSFFISDHSKDFAMIAGGIGITPMRAILKDLEYRDTNKDAMLFYIDSKKDYAFKSELDKIKSENPKIDIVYLEDRKDLEKAIMEYIEEHENDSLYFISGSPNMVKETKSKLKDRGIQRKNIINASFRGYK